MPYVPIGYPTQAGSADLIGAVAHSGADLIELGMPFSDPLADGPVIQHATQIAIENGVTVAKCLELVRDVRGQGVDIPLVLMGYYNPIVHFGVERFAQAARESGTDGVIMADVPIEESAQLRAACEANELDLIMLAAPTSSDQRLQAIGQATRGFLYLVAVIGTTGARDTLPIDLPEFVQRARRATDQPICVGFGISDANAARQVAGLAEGVIVGSALVSRIDNPKTAIQNASKFIAELRAALNPKSVRHEENTNAA